eukprot:scaffold3190_cov409-Prasinococcus_capsulatus_cf.AAC.5
MACTERPSVHRGPAVAGNCDAILFSSMRTLGEAFLTLDETNPNHGEDPHLLIAGRACRDRRGLSERRSD